MNYKFATEAMSVWEDVNGMGESFRKAIPDVRRHDPQLADKMQELVDSLQQVSDHIYRRFGG
jgi:methyl-accepting chemotaxis protein